MKIISVPRIIANLIQLVLSLILVVLSLHLIHLAIGHIFASFHVEEPVEEIFNSIWLITVALAVFDLAGIIYDEISWGATRKELKEFKWQFTKFLIVIITALSIETLVVFFRVAKHDVTLLIYPALAILAICLLVGALSVYIKTSVSSSHKELDDPVRIVTLQYAKGEIDTTEFKDKIKQLKTAS